MKTVKELDEVMAFNLARILRPALWGFVMAGVLVVSGLASPAALVRGALGFALESALAVMLPIVAVWMLFEWRLGRAASSLARRLT